MIDPALVALLMCPACGGEVQEQEQRIVCQRCHRKYPIVNGVPVMLANQAEK